MSETDWGSAEKVEGPSKKKIWTEKAIMAYLRKRTSCPEDLFHASHLASLIRKGLVVKTGEHVPRVIGSYRAQGRTQIRYSVSMVKAVRRE